MKRNSTSRTEYVILNGVASVLSPLTSLLFAFLVIHLSSKLIWGEMVDLLLFYFIATIFYNWGSNAYLMRSFSEIPSRIRQNWQAFFMSRMPVLFLTLIIALIALPQYYIFWLIGGFLFNSIHPILLYKRKFGLIIITELIAFSGLYFGLVYATVTIENLVVLYGGYLWLKSIFYCFSEYPFFLNGSWKFNFKLLVLTIPFFLLNITGFFQSKIDLYIYAFFSDSVALGEYHIISGFLILAQSIPSILIIPFLKNIYRMKNDGVKKMRRLLALTGIFINLFVLLIVVLILDILFAIELSFFAMAIGFLITYPPYIYGIRVFELFKYNQEKTVLFIIFISMVMNFLIALILLSCNFGLNGGLIANACSQLLCLALYLKHTNNDRIPELSE